MIRWDDGRLRSGSRVSPTVSIAFRGRSSVRLGIAHPPSFLAHRQQPSHRLLHLRAALVPGPDKKFGDGSRIVRRVLAAVDPPVISGPGLKGTTGTPPQGLPPGAGGPGRTCRPAQPAGDTSELVIGRRGPDFWVPARICPPAVRPLPGDGPEHLGRFPQGGNRRRRLTEQVTPSYVQQGPVLGCEQRCERIAAQFFHALSIVACPAQRASGHAAERLWTAPAPWLPGDDDKGSPAGYGKREAARQRVSRRWAPRSARPHR